MTGRTCGLRCGATSRSLPRSWPVNVGLDNQDGSQAYNISVWEFNDAGNWTEEKYMASVDVAKGDDGYRIQKDTVDTRDKKSRGRIDKRRAQNPSDELGVG
jgi:hypothetical protein